MSTSSLTQQFAAAVAALAAVSMDVADFQALDDAALVELSHLAAQQKQLAGAHYALVAGEVAYRSSRELGQQGLAQREGYRSPEQFLKATTGSSGREADTAVKVGRLVREAAVAGTFDPQTGELFEMQEPWLAAVAAGVGSGSLSVGAADAIRRGIGVPSENVPAGVLADGVAELVALAPGLDLDTLARRSREMRDDLDELGIADREAERYGLRSFKCFVQSNGMGRVVWDLPPEEFAVVKELFDRTTSPKNGVRFVDGKHKEQAEEILADPRSIGQLASDVFLGLLQAGADAYSSQMLASGAASIRVLVTAKSLSPESTTGHGRIEGLSDPITLASVKRLACSGGVRDITVDSFGQPLDVGREQRFFTGKQRVALAMRDGGCMYGDCDAPPNRSEAHHINEWARDKGKTNIADGILLCKFHHLLLHNNGWQIVRVGSEYYLIPPRDIDPAQTPRFMPSKSAIRRDYLREVRVGVGAGAGAGAGAGVGIGSDLVGA